MIVIIARQLERFMDDATGDVGFRRAVVGNVSDFNVHRDFLHRDAELSEVGVGRELRNSCHAQRVGVDEAVIAALSMESRHTPNAQPLQADDARYGFG